MVPGSKSAFAANYLHQHDALWPKAQQHLGSFEVIALFFQFEAPCAAITFGFLLLMMYDF